MWPYRSCYYIDRVKTKLLWPSHNRERYRALWLRTPDLHQRGHITQCAFPTTWTATQSKHCRCPINKRYVQTETVPQHGIYALFVLWSVCVAFSLHFCNYDKPNLPSHEHLCMCFCSVAKDFFFLTRKRKGNGYRGFQFVQKSCNTMVPHTFLNYYTTWNTSRSE